MSRQALELFFEQRLSPEALAYLKPNTHSKDGQLLAALQDLINRQIEISAETVCQYHKKVLDRYLDYDFNAAKFRTQQAPDTAIPSIKETEDQKIKRNYAADRFIQTFKKYQREPNDSPYKQEYYQELELAHNLLMLEYKA